MLGAGKRAKGRVFGWRGGWGSQTERSTQLTQLSVSRLAAFVFSARWNLLATSLLFPFN